MTNSSGTTHNVIFIIVWTKLIQTSKYVFSGFSSFHQVWGLNQIKVHRLCDLESKVHKVYRFDGILGILSLVNKD
jgi:hypothetical protein